MSPNDNGDVSTSPLENFENYRVVPLTIKVRASDAYTRLSVVGNIPELGSWDVAQSVPLDCQSETNQEDDVGDSLTWTSKRLQIPSSRFPIKLKFIVNGHRSSPNTRPLVWDLSSRVIPLPPRDNSTGTNPEGGVLFNFDPTADDSGSGWVHRGGVGAFQLRVAQLPGSSDPLVTLCRDVTDIVQNYKIELFEAHGRDLTVPQGKSFAKIGRYSQDESSIHSEDSTAVTYLLNAQSIKELEFRIDLISKDTGALIARGIVPFKSLEPLEGFVSAALMSVTTLRHIGTFHAAFLIVTGLEHPKNTLGCLQRSRWVPNKPTLDIGHRGSGASRVQGHSVRENTVLSFQKAALNHSDFIEFDVHATADGQVVVHHDFQVRLALGKEEVKVPISTLSSQQLLHPAFAQHLVTPTEHREKPAIDIEKNRRNLSLKRTMTSGEDMYHSIFNKPMMATSSSSSVAKTIRAYLSDPIASLKGVFRSTPSWLGFNIELKYPTNAEKDGMGTSFYSRNYFVDAVLRVVFEEAEDRHVIFSTFDPDCATLLNLKQPRYPVFFLTCGGTKIFADPRMNSLEAAIQFALGSQLQGVVAEATSVLDRLDEVVGTCHKHGIFLFTWGDINNDMASYLKQKTAGVDAIIMDDIAKMSKAQNKQQSLFKGSQNILAVSPVGSPQSL